MTVKHAISMDRQTILTGTHAISMLEDALCPSSDILRTDGGRWSNAGLVKEFLLDLGRVLP
jgi:hypothetical protein